jgi:hypothetical protein
MFLPEFRSRFFYTGLIGSAGQFLNLFAISAKPIGLMNAIDRPRQR